LPSAPVLQVARTSTLITSTVITSSPAISSNTSSVYQYVAPHRESILVAAQASPLPLARASTRERKASTTLRQSVASQKKRGRTDPEVAAVIRNCGMIDEEEEEPLKKKKVGKIDLNKDFFQQLPNKVHVRSTSFYVCTNC
jgi:hypothetical protein